jgi:dienelactone hydrolase
LAGIGGTSPLAPPEKLGDHRLKRKGRLKRSMHAAIRLSVFRFAFVFIVAALFAGQSRADDIRLDALKIPIIASDGRGSSSAELEAIVLRPDDRLPHPLAVINHGSPRLASDRPAMSPYGMWLQATAFARRGWTAVVFMRRGYGRSQGEWAETFGACGNPNYADAGRTGASDIAAVAKFMRTQPYVSKAKWISVGVSAGGFATVALTADPPPGLAAAIAFAPGRGSSGPDTVCGENQLVAAFAQYGKTSRVPLLWVSAENDHFFGPRLVTRMTGAFSQSGGNVALIKVAAFGADGHQFFGAANALPIWTPIVDKFLAANNLTLRERLIDIATPDIAPPAHLGSNGREAFKTYLQGGPNKAFAVNENGRFGWASGRRSIDDARKNALEFCAPGRCTVVNVNNEPVE